VQRHLLTVLTISLLSITLGHRTGRWARGAADEFWGAIEAVLVVIYCFLGIVFLLFAPYGGRISHLMQRRGVRIICTIVCTMALAFTIYFIVFTTWRIRSIVG